MDGEKGVTATNRKAGHQVMNHTTANISTTGRNSLLQAPRMVATTKIESSKNIGRQSEIVAASAYLPWLKSALGWQIGEIPANAYPLLLGLQSGTRRACPFVVEDNAIVREVTCTMPVPGVVWPNKRLIKEASLSVSP